MTMNMESRIATRWLSAMDRAPEIQALVDGLTRQEVIDYPIQVIKFGAMGSGMVEIRLLRDLDGVKVEVGKFVAEKMSTTKYKQMSEHCLAPFKKLQRKYSKYLELYVVAWAYLHDSKLWHQGIGKAAYLDILREAGSMGAVVAPHWCVPGGSTTDKAKRVWDSLSKTHEMIGPIVIPKNLRV